MFILYDVYYIFGVCFIGDVFLVVFVVSVFLFRDFLWFFID